MTDLATVRTLSPDDLDALLPLVAAFHRFEGIDMAPDTRRTTIAGLLSGPSMGEIWGVYQDGGLIGYMALAFGYSIEFTGRDAFIDEFFILPDRRGRGIGGRVVDRVGADLARRGFVALHLEVARDNDRAGRLYQAHGFQWRTRYSLMSSYLTDGSD